MTKPAKDRIYVSKQTKIDDFVFDDKVANVFADMIQRSVPGYAALNHLLPTVAKFFIQPDTNVYDLGCSLGEASLSIANTIRFSDVNIYAVDNSQAMIDRLTERLELTKTEKIIEPICTNILDIKIDNASLVILNYTLQFIDRVRRDELISNIYSGLHVKGALLLSEKISNMDVDEEVIMQELHENYKRDNDYTDLEISQKREALENVLIRDTHNQHIKRLNKAGFSKVYMLTKYLNFMSYVAVK